jgi:CheY-like chemotaxis protein
MDGIDVATILRRESPIPIIMLTARVEETDRLRGLEVGAGQSGAAQHVPPNLPKEAAAQFAKIAESVFGHGYVSAMRPTMGLPIVIVLIAFSSRYLTADLRGAGR